MKTIIILKGLPSCGKTTFAKETMESKPSEYKRVNKDDLRTMIDNGRWSKHNEKMVLKLRDQIILESLEQGKNVIVDDTNLHPKHEINIRNLVKGKKVEVIIYDAFEKDPKKCIEYDLKRSNSVGAKVILGMYNQFMKPEIKKLEAPFDIKLPNCIICDIDGTIAEKGDRSPYDWEKVGLDIIKDEIRELSNSYFEDNHVILLSGRDSSCKKETIEWLRRNGVFFSQLYMRKADDNRKDSIIKREFYEKHIKGKFNVLFVLDDRDQVVDMWRNQLGLTCLQVDYGEF